MAPNTSRVRVDDEIFLSCLEYGDRRSAEDRVVLFLHGFPDLSSSWKFQAEKLVEDGYFVVAPDLRGYGSSSIPKGGVSAYGKEQLVSDVDGLRRYYCGDDGSFAMIVGHDWGGVIVWAALETFATGGDDAKQSSQLAKCAVILNAPHPVTFEKEMYTVAQALKSSYMLWFQFPVLTEMVLSRSRYLLDLSGVEKTHPALAHLMHGDGTDNTTCSATPEDIDAELAVYKTFVTDYRRVQAALSYYRAMAAGLWASSEKRSIVTWLMGHVHSVSYDASKRSPSFEAGGSSIEVPTLILWGRSDPYLGQELAYPPAGKVETLEGPIFLDAGHWVHWEKPFETTDAILKFANRHAKYYTSDTV
eukprot:scaffold504_cov109-Cylindrotheca_fusiformis.AAC.1